MTRGRRAPEKPRADRLRVSARASIAACALLVSWGLGASPQAALGVVARTQAGRVVSYQPTVTRARAARPLAFGSTATTSSTATTYTQCSTKEAACLTYYGGPVMRTATLTPVFWNPTGLGLSYPSGYRAAIERFFVDLAADSGSETSFYSVLPQYYDTLGGGVHHIEYSVSDGTPIEDTDALPSAPEDLCATPFENSGRPCVRDSGVRAELTGLLAKDGLPTGVGHEYVVFFPEGIDSCFDEGGSGDEECSGTGYCGYHGTIATGGGSSEIEYANEPDNGDPRYGGGCTTAKGLEAAAITLSSTSHEISESVTDPEVETTLSWYDTKKLGEYEYAEIGDICAYEYAQGEAGGLLLSGHLKAPGGTSNQTINGHSYLLQDEWDNAHATCSISERASATRALFSDSASAPVTTGQGVSFDASGSFAPVAIKRYEWEWGDGTTSSGSSPTAEHTFTETQGSPLKAYTVKLTVTDENGNRASATHTVEVEDRPPTAEFSVPSELAANAPAGFDASLSNDPDGSIASYSWEFGDGTPTQTGSSPLQTHTYATAGEYTVTLRVTDDAGATSSISHAVLVEPGSESHPETEEKQSEEQSEKTGSEAGTTNQGGEEPPANVGTSGPTAPVTTTTATSSLGTATIQTGDGSSQPPARLGLRVLSIKHLRHHRGAELTIGVPGGGELSVHEAWRAHASLVSDLGGVLLAPAAYPVALRATSKAETRARVPLVKAFSLRVGAAESATLRIIPSAAGRARLARKHKLTVKLLIVFTANGGARMAVAQTLTLR